jgi:DeoR/GlpR family transcriptional regulator of sugar metabolism
MDGYLKEERQQLILKALEENGRVTVQELSHSFGTSEVTIRRDLSELVASGHLIRAHRGALSVVSAPPEPPVVQRLSIEHEPKAEIARLAAGLVSDGDSIFIGSGSTMACFARQAASHKRLTVITNAINIAVDLAAAEGDLSIVVIGGVLRAPELSLLGHIAEQTLPEVRVRKIFMGVQALSIENGWTTDHMPEVTTTRRILDMARELVILADHTKLGQTAAALIAPITRITTLVTDPGADEQFLNRLRAVGIQVLVAGK